MLTLDTNFRKWSAFVLSIIAQHANKNPVSFMWFFFYMIKRTEKIIVVIKNKEIGFALLPDLFLPKDGGAWYMHSSHIGHE